MITRRAAGLMFGGPARLNEVAHENRGLNVLASLFPSRQSGHLKLATTRK